jgi:hypothetical protein
VRERARARQSDFKVDCSLTFLCVIDWCYVCGEVVTGKVGEHFRGECEQFGDSYDDDSSGSSDESSGGGALSTASSSSSASDSGDSDADVPAPPISRRRAQRGASQSRHRRRALAIGSTMLNVVFPFRMLHRRRERELRTLMNDAGDNPLYTNQDFAC